GSPEMAEEASRRLGRAVGTLLFDDLDEVEMYDGVWANACLLHVPRDELAPILALIWRAIKPGGYFYASYKTGEADGRDTLNRLPQRSLAGLDARDIHRCRKLEFILARTGRGERLRQQAGCDAVLGGAESALTPR